MLAAILLLLAVVFYRVVAAVFFGDSSFATGMSNFSPLAAVVLCSAVFLPGRLALPLAFGSLLLSDLLLNHHYGAGLDVAFFAKYGAFALVYALGHWYRRSQSPALPGMFAAVLTSAVLFYLITNTACWLGSPAYAKTFAGWLQALTTGVPGFPPTWMFFRNSLAGDLVFSALFILAVRPELFRLRATPPVAVPVGR